MSILAKMGIARFTKFAVPALIMMSFGLGGLTGCHDRDDRHDDDRAMHDYDHHDDHHDDHNDDHHDDAHYDNDDH